MDTLRAAVIGRTGHGDYGHGIDLVWNDLPGVQLVAVADDNKMGLAAKARQLKLDKAYADYRQMLDEVKPDLVSIGCRWLDQHRDIVVETANRGVHIYLEKPLCRTLAEADEMVYALERTHAKLVIAHTTRHSPKTKVVEQMIRDGKIGRIMELRGRGKEDQRGGGEDLWVLGSHIMDLIRIFGGSPSWCFATVTAGGHPVTKSDVYEGNEGIGPLAGDALAAMYGLGDNATAYFASQRKGGSGAHALWADDLWHRGCAGDDDRLPAQRALPARAKLVGRPDRGQVAQCFEQRARPARNPHARQRPQRQPPVRAGAVVGDPRKSHSQRRHL